MGCSITRLWLLINESQFHNLIAYKLPQDYVILSQQLHRNVQAQGSLQTRTFWHSPHQTVIGLVVCRLRLNSQNCRQLLIWCLHSKFPPVDFQFVSLCYDDYAGFGHFGEFEGEVESIELSLKEFPPECSLWLHYITDMTLNLCSLI